MHLPENVVWHSTRESIRAGKISVLACSETVAAVILAFAFIGLTGIYTQLLISLCVAPLVLLRSDPAVEMACRWFQGKPKTGKKRRLWHHVVFGAVGAMVGGALSYWLSLTWVQDHTG